MKAKLFVNRHTHTHTLFLASVIPCLFLVSFASFRSDSDKERAVLTHRARVGGGYDRGSADLLAGPSPAVRPV